VRRALYRAARGSRAASCTARSAARPHQSHNKLEGEHFRPGNSQFDSGCSKASGFPSQGPGFPS